MLLAKNAVFFNNLVILRLDLGQIIFNLVENAFARRMLAALPLESRFTTFWLGHACALGMHTAYIRTQLNERAVHEFS